MKIYGLPEDQGPDCQNDMAPATGHIIRAVQALALRQSINLHSALSLGYYCFSSMSVQYLNLIIANISPRFKHLLSCLQAQARLGMSVAVVDVNLDGYDDLVVGGPSFVMSFSGNAAPLDYQV